MAGITDEEAVALLPVVDEFLAAVEEQDAGFIDACLSYDGRAKAIAVLCAAHLLKTESDLEDSRQALRDTRRELSRLTAAYDQMRAELDDARTRIKDLRSFLTAKAAASTARRGR